MLLTLKRQDFVPIICCCRKTVLNIVWIRNLNLNRNFSKVGSGTALKHYLRFHNTIPKGRGLELYSRSSLSLVRLRPGPPPRYACCRAPWACRPRAGPCTLSYTKKINNRIRNEPVLRIRDMLSRIRISDKRIWIRILLFLSVTFKAATKNDFFLCFFCLLLFEAKYIIYIIYIIFQR
jgi:hypothetical protein